MEATLLNYETCRRFALPKHIAVATDLTDAEMLLPYAIAQARVTGAHLTLIHALQSHSATPKTKGRLISVEDQEQEIDAMDRLEDLRRRAHLKGVCCSIRLNHGEPKEVILEALRRTNADRLIAGSHGRRRLRDVMRGSVARELMAAVTIPTLYIGPNVHPVTDVQTRNILCLLSLEGEYEKLARFALLLGEVHQAHVTLMHVLNDADTINQTRSEQWARNVLQSLIDRFGRREKKASVDIKHGGLLDAARRATLQTDVLVLGTCTPAHSSRLKDLLTYQVIATAGCPVYCYRVETIEDQPHNVEFPMFAACTR